MKIKKTGSRKNFNRMFSPFSPNTEARKMYKPGRASAKPVMRSLRFALASEVSPANKIKLGRTGKENIRS